MKMRYVFGLLLSVMSVSSIQAMDDLYKATACEEPTPATWDQFFAATERFKARHNRVRASCEECEDEERERYQRRARGLELAASLGSGASAPYVAQELASIVRTFNALAGESDQVFGGVRVAHTHHLLSSLAFASIERDFQLAAFANLFNLLDYLQLRYRGEDTAVPEFTRFRRGIHERMIAKVLDDDDKGVYPGDWFALAGPSACEIGCCYVLCAAQKAQEEVSASAE